MTLPRYAVRADRSAQGIVVALETMGFYVHRISVPVDALVSRNGSLYAVEFKTGKGKLTPAQQRYRDRAKAPVHILRDAAGAIEWAQSLVVKKADKTSQRHQADDIDRQHP